LKTYLASISLSGLQSSKKAKRSKESCQLSALSLQSEKDDSPRGIPTRPRSSVSTEAIFHRASRKGAKDEAKPAGSEQRALGSKKANTRKQLAKIKQQQAVRNQPLRLGFLKSDLPTAYCYLPTGFPLRAWRLGANNLVEVVMLNILSVRM